MNFMNLETISKKLLFLLFSGALFMTSCKKDKEPGSNPGGQSKKLIKVEESATDYTTFDYNTDGSLKKMTTVEPDAEGTETTVINYTYNAQGKISESNIDGAIKFKYLYANSKVDKMEMYSGNLKAMYYVFEYNNTRISKITKYTNEGTATAEDFELSGKTECTYFDNGNLKEIKEYMSMTGDAPILSFTQQFSEYDTKVSPFKSLGESNFGFMLHYSSANNILKQKLLHADGSTESESVYTYTYDASGNPLTGTNRTTVNGNTTTSATKYIYQ